tara:strand:+ start:30444 stop:31766 length:1323 start_codon:yes stop_codon:yes gene_type:complete
MTKKDEIEPFDVDWQEKLVNSLVDGSWGDDVQWDDDSIAPKVPKENKVDPTNHDFILDIVYFAARKLKGKKLTQEHEKMFNEFNPVLDNQAVGDFHTKNIETHANVRDEDTDERDDKYYPNDRLHSTDEKKASWEETLKAPFPNHMLGNRKARGGRKIRRGTGKNGLFKYSEIDELLEDKVTPLIDDRYEKEIDKLTKKNVRDSKKRLKEGGKEMTQEMIAYITKRVRKQLESQKENNVYATAYGKHSSTGSGFQSKGNWFAGGLSPLGYNPNNQEQMAYVMKRVSGLGNRYFEDWKSPKEKEGKDLQDRYNTLKDLKSKASLENDEKRLKTIEANMKNIEQKAEERNIVLKSVPVWATILKNVQYEGTCKKCKTFKRKGDKCELNLPAYGVVSFGTSCPMKIKDDRFAKDLGAVTSTSAGTKALFNNKAINRKRKEEDE